ncbi:MAG TPA: hypothetical protein VK578_20560 [Edaphobacter sp.]|nr:hypothetical protein [Edaphobacter sp.]
MTLALFGVMGPFTMAQVAETPASTEAMLTLPDSPALPDSPGTVLVSSSMATSDDAAASGGQPMAPAKPIALPRVKLISANQAAPSQTASDKVIMGLRETVTPYSVIGWFVSAGWSHLIDSSPNYGTNSQAFAQRLGASAALASSRGIFSDSILGPILHQDTRYYQLGRDHKFINRAIYAGTRPIIGKTDGGRTIPNYAFLLATAGSSGLTVTYYPEKNQSGGQVAETFASSLGGAALGALVNEFGGDVIRALHLSRNK